MVSLNERYYATASNSHHVIQKSTELLSLIREGESGQRGYIITNDPEYLKPFSEARSKFDTIFTEFKEITDTAVYSQANIDNLEKLLRNKMNELTATISLRRENRNLEALNVVRSDRGRLLMNEIAGEIEKLIREEKSRLTEHQNDVKKYAWRTKVYSVLSNTVLLAVAISSIINIRSNRKSIRRLFGEVEEKNTLLENQTSDLQRLSHDLIQQNRELERFAYVASHDLRAPAANMEALLRLYQEAKNQKERENLVETMHDVSENLSTKLNELVDSLRDKNEISRSSETLSFQPIYDTIIQNLSVEVRKSNATIEHDFSDAPQITAPKSYLESILQNLISNAIKYRSPGRVPVIKVRSYKDKERICFEVSDNGLGIDLNKYGGQLFGLYQTFHNHRDSKGVGLYITRAQVLSLGGRIDVDSTPGEGSTFRVCL
ncbi:MAG TPA: CHASE3 domain-containing protein [Sphingobacteriaceae bacterium]